MQKKNLIVFDIDGTLTNTVHLHQMAFKKGLQSIGVSTFNDAFSTYKHHTDLHIARVIYESSTGNPFLPATLHTFETFLYEEIKQETILEINGAKKLIEKLELHTDFGVCFATGSLYQPATLKLNRIGVSFNPLQLVASNTIEERENIVNQAIHNAKQYYSTSQFDRIIAVGDGLWDLLTAKNLNLEFIGIGTSNREIMQANGMLTHFEDLQDFTF
ncbi:HAD hydrolase-like protein [Myroides sp. 1354]|uniref:HAD family hydrolase n=1 Tax=unclassified Myroides TaxID=2642485 RepID=UPI002574B646|nr:MULTISPECIES: HAD hydrolase-like protein [unclassified Myroides]MDM1045659.1 HAD hydrolase-like protein [Myroides sp. R163-1]MDM1056661.1 HAD hydrolase-like protein [Myroides sp. 1354]MDM1069789.1 HAD hydrolase-like protein [Myroides sp. 1372]